MVEASASLVGRRSAASVLMVATLAAMALIIALSVFANDAEAAYARRQLTDETDGYWGTTTGPSPDHLRTQSPWTSSRSPTLTPTFPTNSPHPSRRHMEKGWTVGR